jgi:AcrR family transcriptional regulator
MRRNATRDGQSVVSDRELPVNQRAGLETLPSGKTITESADAAGVNRATLHRWLRDDYAFCAHLNAARREVRETTFARIEALAERAIDVLRDALQKDGDGRVTLEVLKGTGLLDGGRQVGSTNSEILRREEEHAISSRLSDLAERALVGSLRPKSFKQQRTT